MTPDFSQLAGDLAPGDRVASYLIQEQIGVGGMAVVFRALDLRLDRQVALKVLAPRLAEDEAFRQRFIRESRAAAGVDHPHIIPVFEAGEAGGVLFIAMRYVAFGDVRTLIEAEGRLSSDRVTEITGQVASALDAAHAHGLIHRDVKPGNILIAATGGSSTDHVYLSDFGLSKTSLASSTLTSTGQFMGTLDYVSPEQIQGQPADGRADQYALACTVVEMLSGAPPYKRDESMALLWAQLEAPPPDLRERLPDLPPEVNVVISRALAKSPADRYPTCLAFASALRAAFGPRGPAAGPADRAGQRRRRALRPQAPAARPGRMDPGRSRSRHGATGASRQRGRRRPARAHPDCPRARAGSAHGGNGAAAGRSRPARTAAARGRDCAAGRRPERAGQAAPAGICSAGLWPARPARTRSAADARAARSRRSRARRHRPDRRGRRAGVRRLQAAAQDGGRQHSAARAGHADAGGLLRQRRPSRPTSRRSTRRTSGRPGVWSVTRARPTRRSPRDSPGRRTTPSRSSRSPATS